MEIKLSGPTVVRNFRAAFFCPKDDESRAAQRKTGPGMIAWFLGYESYFRVRDCRTVSALHWQGGPQVECVEFSGCSERETDELLECFMSLARILLNASFTEGEIQIDSQLWTFSRSQDA